MPTSQQPTRYRFGVFEADPVTGELRRQGRRIKLNAQPFQVLMLLLARPGELLTRDEIASHLWPGETFVDFDHGLNSAINRIREALGDTAASPRFVETLARRGYRFIAPVEGSPPLREPTAATTESDIAQNPDSIFDITLLATEADLPRTSYRVVQTLFVLLQLMYLGFYIGALANLPEISGLLSDIFHTMPSPAQVFIVMVISAAVMIPMRTFLFTAALFHAPTMKMNFLKLWPFLLLMDLLWSLSPFLLLHHMDAGVALACVPFLVYSPFAQRSLILMGAGTRHNLA